MLFCVVVFVHLISTFIFLPLFILCRQHIHPFCVSIQCRLDNPAWLPMRGGLGPIFLCRLGFPRSMACVLEGVWNGKFNISPQWFDFSVKCTSTGRTGPSELDANVHWGNITDDLFTENIILSFCHFCAALVSMLLSYVLCYRHGTMAWKRISHHRRFMIIVTMMTWKLYAENALMVT